MSLLLAVLAVMTRAPALRAQDIEFASMASEYGVSESFLTRFASMESELETLRAQAVGHTTGAVKAECCDACCCGGGGWIAMVEATYFRYGRADGTRVGDAGGDETFDTDYEITPRVTLGYQKIEGLGVRLRWWEYDESTTSPDGGTALDHAISVDTYTVDLEAFRTVDLCYLTVELSGGVRYNEFDELLVNAGGLVEDRRNSFKGFGGVVGLEAVADVGCYGSVYGRLRGAMIMDDKRVQNLDNIGGASDETLLNTTQGMWELAVGYQVTRCWNGYTVVVRAGVEWQNWYNYSTNIGLDEGTFEGPSDVGFFGYTLGGGITY